MGPIILFDKSFLQSLNIDEAVLFDSFFTCNIPPIFFVETVADLEKNIRAGRTSEDEVRIIADKTPQISGTPCTLHINLAIGNLLGSSVPMSGRQIPIPGGKHVRTADRSGVIFDIPAEIMGSGLVS